MSERVAHRQSIRLGRTMKLPCPVEGDPPPLIMWTKDGRNIHSGWTRFRVLQHALRIKEVETDDAGTYICKATNGFGSVNINYTLIVIGKQFVKTTLLWHETPKQNSGLNRINCTGAKKDLRAVGINLLMSLVRRKTYFEGILVSLLLKQCGVVYFLWECLCMCVLYDDRPVKNRHPWAKHVYFCSPLLLSSHSFKFCI